MVVVKFKVGTENLKRRLKNRRNQIFFCIFASDKNVSSKWTNN